MLYDGFQCGKRVGDININYATAGRGPPLLLLHGFPQNLAMWARVVPILAADFTMVCADLRGNGDSSRPACAPDRANYSFPALAGDHRFFDIGAAWRNASLPGRHFFIDQFRPESARILAEFLKTCRAS
jgi:pimeloyl-ACP methyl ester carboxylesterase